MASCSDPANAATPYFPPDLIPKIARRLTSLQDFFALRGSCRAYRAVLPLTRSNLASQAPLLLLVPTKDQATESPALFHFALRRLLRFRLPRPRQDSSCSGFFSLGCRVLICDYPRGTDRCEPRMVHLLTGEQTRLPSTSSFGRAVLCGDILLTWSYFTTAFKFCRLGATDWSVASIGQFYNLEGMICVNGTIYVLVSCYLWDSPVYHLAVVELSDNNRSSVQLEFLGALDARALHLPVGTELSLFPAECRGELILFATMEYNPMVYHAFSWKSEEAKWVRITSLGGCALFFACPYFVGCLGPDHPGIRKDCIYFCEDDLWSEYSSVDGSFRKSDAFNPGGKLQESFRPSVWFFPSMC